MFFQSCALFGIFGGASSKPVIAEAKHFLPIHREAPSFQDQGTEQEILVTGIKVLRMERKGTTLFTFTTFF